MGMALSNGIAVNILALGLANLIGGLFVIGHNVSLSFQLLLVIHDSIKGSKKVKEKSLIMKIKGMVFC